MLHRNWQQTRQFFFLIQLVLPGHSVLAPEQNHLPHSFGVLHVHGKIVVITFDLLVIFVIICIKGYRRYTVYLLELPEIAFSR